MEVSNGEIEQKVLPGQELSSSRVERGSGSSETGPSTSLVYGGAPRKLADHEKQVGEFEEEKEENQDNIRLHGPQEEDEGNDEPGSQEDSERIGEVSRISCVCAGNTQERIKEGTVGQPKTAV